MVQLDPGCSAVFLFAVLFPGLLSCSVLTVHHNWMEGRVGNETSKLVQLLFQCLPQVMSPKFDHLSAQPQVIGEPVNRAHMVIQ